MNILHVASHVNIGGVSRYILSLSQALHRRGHRVVIASGGGELEAEAVASGVTHWRVPLHTSAEFSLQADRATRQLAARLQQERPDILHAHTRVGQVVAHRLSQRHSIPYVTTWHGFFRPNIGRWLLPCTGDVTIAISEPVRQHLQRVFHVPADRIRLIPNGIDVAYFAVHPAPSAIDAFRARWRIPPGRPTIGGMGRLASGSVKGFDLLLASAARLSKTMPKLGVIIVGDGPGRQLLEANAKRCGLSERVCFTGLASDVRIPLALMDVFVFPVRSSEGFGLSLIEAMAAGKPVVATHTGAVPDIIEHAQSGWLVPPEDPGALTEAVGRLLRDGPTAAALGANAQERVRQHFSLDRMVTQVEAVYAELLSRQVR